METIGWMLTLHQCPKITFLCGCLGENKSKNGDEGGQLSAHGQLVQYNMVNADFLFNFTQFYS